MRDNIIAARPPGNLSARSIQLGTAVAPSLPQRYSACAGRSWLQCWQVTNNPRTPCRRMPPSVMGRIGSSMAMPAS
jgi:hypothetical protein